MQDERKSVLVAIRVNDIRFAHSISSAFVLATTKRHDERRSNSEINLLTRT